MNYLDEVFGEWGGYSPMSTPLLVMNDKKYMPTPRRPRTGQIVEVYGGPHDGYEIAWVAKRKSIVLPWRHGSKDEALSELVGGADDRPTYEDHEYVVGVTPAGKRTYVHAGRVSE